METIRWLVHSLDSHSGAANVLLTFVLILVTGFYAWKAKQQADEAEKLRVLQSNTLDYQKEIELNKNIELVRQSALIIYIDLFAAINEIIKIAQIKRSIKYRPQNIQFCEEYAIYLSNISSKLDFDEILLIRRVYGMLDRYSSYFFDRNNEWLANMIDAAEVLGAEFFEDNEHYYSTAARTNYNVFYDQLIINDMEEKYRRLFMKLKKLI